MLTVIKNLNKKGFTITELLIVIAILAVLVLLAMLGFKGYKERARIVHIKHDVKVAEGLVGEYLIRDSSLPDMWVSSNPEESTRDVYDTRGLVDTVMDGNYKIIPKSEFKTNLPGNFHANEGGKVYYEDDKLKEIAIDIEDLIDSGFIPIASAEELQQINDDSNEVKIWGADTKYEMTHVGGLDQKYIQVKDVDLKGYANWTPIGIRRTELELVNIGSTPYIDEKLIKYAPFTGEYNGGNYAIKNLTIKEDLNVKSNVEKVDDKYKDKIVGAGIALFGAVDGTPIFSNIKMKDVSVHTKDANHQVAGLVGITSGEKITIKNTSISGSVKADAGNAGGVIFRTNSKVVDINDVEVNGSVYGLEKVGGLVNQSDNVDKVSLAQIKTTGDIKAGPNGTTGGLYNTINTDNNGGELNISNVSIDSNIDGYEAAGLINDINHHNETNINNIEVNGDIKSINGEAAGLIRHHNMNDNLAVNRLSISNVNVNSSISSNNGSISGLIANAYRANTIGIQNIKINGDISNTGYSSEYAAGLISHINMSEKSVEKKVDISQVYLNKSVNYNGGGIVGGLIAEINNARNINVRDIEINEKVSNGAMVGGIIGLNTMDFNSSENSLIISNVKLNDDVSSGWGRAAGLIAENYHSNDSTFNDINVNGYISTDSGAGGLVAIDSMSNKNYNKQTITNVKLNGNVESKDWGMTGGLIAENYGSNETYVDSVSISGDIISNENNAGGLFGHNGMKAFVDGNEFTVSNINVNSNINGKFAGGLTGQSYNKSKVAIKDIEIIGKVNGEDQAGGLTGHSNMNLDDNNNKQDILNVIVNADVKGDYAGGLFGQHYNSYDTTFKNVEVLKDISGNENIGGLIGDTNSIFSEISRIIVNGNVNGGVDTGGLLGKSVRDIRLLINVSLKGNTISGGSSGSGATGGLIGSSGFWEQSINMEDVTLKDLKIVNAGDAVGGVIGNGLVGNSKIIMNDFSIDDISIDGLNYTGGLVGEILASGVVEFSNIKSSGVIKGREHVGGLIGFTLTDPITKSVTVSTDITGTNYVGKGYGANYGNTTGNTEGVDASSATVSGPGRNEMMGDWY